MKKSNRLIIFLLISFSFLQVRSDEGMWLPLFLDRLTYENMQKMGLNLTQEEIYSINNGSLKDAIVIFGGGCTGEIVSNQGLIFTNHHCGYASIAALSTVENDYLTNGYLAASQNDELFPSNNLSVKFLLRIENVSKKILESIPENASEIERNSIIEKISSNIEKVAAPGEYQEAVVKSFFYGNEYYLFVYEVYPDVRLVMTPPSSIGNFGGDTDNWMWPRHTGDFSVFRVYTDQNGKPAKYNKNNIPMKPKHFLPVSLKERKENDFTMILGYPGRTSRYITSDEVESNYKYVNPSIVKIREKKLQIMDKNMKADDNVRIKYASQYASTANYWKFYIGQNKGIEDLNVIDEKRQAEKEFLSWANNLNNSNEYKSALENVRKAIKELSSLRKVQIYISEAFFRGSSVINFAGRFRAIAKELSSENPNQDKINDYCKNLENYSNNFFETFDYNTELELFGAMLEIYAKNIPQEYQPKFYNTIRSKFKNDYKRYSEYSFLISPFANKEIMKTFLNNPKKNAIVNDPIFTVTNQIYDIYFNIQDKISPFTDLLNSGMRVYMQGFRKMNKNNSFYPDANSTMRLSYGTVKAYKKADAYNYYFKTTLKGVMEKEDPNDEEFIVPAKLKELYNKKDFGQYGENGKLITCFITNNDITGGNSGSPVLNGNGELIGLAFDGNWEAMSGDIVFDPKFKRCICVDIRYVLFVIDKFAGGKRIIDELDLRK